LCDVNTLLNIMNVFKQKWRLFGRAHDKFHFSGMNIPCFIPLTPKGESIHGIQSPLGDLACLPAKAGGKKVKFVVRPFSQLLFINID